jgi:hypothetical protein
MNKSEEVKVHGVAFGESIAEYQVIRRFCGLSVGPDRQRDYPTLKQGLRDPRIRTKWANGMEYKNVQ